MKVLLFTHKGDIDGMGPVILAKLSFDSINYVFSEFHELNGKIEAYINDSSIYEYDYVYVTDLCIHEPLLSKINDDEKLKNKFMIFDHHQTTISEGSDKYPFVNVVVKDELGMCSGTSLFYKYLNDNKHIIRNSNIDKFVELVRRQDTWEWKTIYNDEMANELSILFNLLGRDKFIGDMYEKLSSDYWFNFSPVEKALIENKKAQIELKMGTYLESLTIRDVLGFKAGILFIESEYRNDIAEYFRTCKVDIDFVMMVIMEKNSISYRTIKEGIDVSKIAEHFGGGGHANAASSMIDNDIKEEIIKLLIKND